MEHTIKAHLSIILEKSLKFTGVWLDDRLPFFTSKTFEVSTRPHLLSCIFAIFDCSKFPYFFNAKSVAYSIIPENEKEIQGGPTLTWFSLTRIPQPTIFCLCTRKSGIFALVAHCYFRIF